MTTRAEAKALGLRKYHGKPCRHGHDGLRYITAVVLPVRIILSGGKGRTSLLRSAPEK